MLFYPFHVYVKFVDFSDEHFIFDVVISFVLKNVVGFKSVFQSKCFRVSIYALK